MKTTTLVIASMMALTSAFAFADDLLGENRGSGGGGTTVGSSGGNSGGNRGDSGGNRGNGNGNSRSSEDRGRIGSESRGNDAPVRVESRGRTGTPRYNSNNNLRNTSRDSRSASNAPIRVESFHEALRGGELARQARTEEDIRRGWNQHSASSFRSGYYNSWDNWYDNRFCYPHYGFNWNPRQFVVSPFYGYTHVPGYITQTRIRFGSFWIEFTDLDDYRYDPRARYDRNYEYRGLNTAVDDLIRAFTRRDLRALDRLVPTRDSVRVRGDWAGDYTLGSDDFYDMMRDVVTTTQTRIFSIQDVDTGRGWTVYNQGYNSNRNQGRGFDYDRRDEADFAIVRAEHHFQDGWRRMQCTELEFVLERDRRGNYQIVEFASYGRN